MRRAYAGLGGIIFMVLFALVFLRIELAGRAVAEYDVILMGDSIFASVQGEGSVADRISQMTGLRVADCSFGGSSMAYRDTEARLGKLSDCFCMAALSQAACAGDFRVQKCADIHEVATEYFRDRTLFLETVDFSKAQILVIGHLVNDYFSAVPIERPGAESEYDYSGALKTSVERIREKYPNLRIVLVSTPYYWNDGEPGEDIDYGGGTLEDYVKAQEALAAELDLEWVDLYHGLYAPEGQEKDLSPLAYTMDGLHPSEGGRALIAEKIAQTLTETGR